MHLPDLSRARVLIVGDTMLDRYWFGEVHRISPEAPVPVVRIASTEERPGGAANVARNAAALGATVWLLSVVGTDEAGDRLAALMTTERVHVSLHRDPSVATTVKLRVVGRQQQLLRIDFESMPSHEVLAGKLADFRTLLAEVDTVILSDYGKGVLTHIDAMISAARTAGCRVLVDPKGDEYSKYRGASIMTPNRAELREVVGRWTGESDLTERAQALRRELALDALLLTRSEEGMTLYRESGALHQRALAREVFDVSGAGDTVIATLATLLSAGASLEDAVQAANHAGGIVVGKLGTAIVTPDELRTALAVV